MKEVYYRGMPYTYDVVESSVGLIYHLREINVPVLERDLDIRTRCTIILDRYFSSEFVSSSRDRDAHPYSPSPDSASFSLRPSISTHQP